MNENENLELLCQILKSVSEQMRGSLGNIHMALGRLMPAEDEATGSDDRTRSAEILSQSYHRLLRVIGNLSEATLLTREKPLPVWDTELVSWLEDLCGQARPLVEEMGLTLIFRCEKTSHVAAVNTAYLERLFWNLLSNAIKFTAPGGMVTVELSVRGGQVLLSVSDTGCGISQDRMATVYERYLHPEQKDPQPYGLGLGLPLCRKIAELHGGRFLLTSREGEGTTATVALPDERLGNSAMEELPPDYYGGFQNIMVELSDALPYRAFTRKNLDD